MNVPDSWEIYNEYQNTTGSVRQLYDGFYQKPPVKLTTGAMIPVVILLAKCNNIVLLNYVWYAITLGRCNDINTTFLLLKRGEREEKKKKNWRKIGILKSGASDQSSASESRGAHVSDINCDSVSFFFFTKSHRTRVRIGKYSKSALCRPSQLDREFARSVNGVIVLRGETRSELIKKKKQKTKTNHRARREQSQ